MNLNDTFDLMNKSTAQGFANLRKAAEINLNTWDQLVASQMNFMGQCLETAGAQAELLKTVKRPDELLSRQTELARGLGEQLVAGNRQLAEVFSKASDEYQALFEASVEQTRDQLDAAAAAVRTADAA